MPSFVFTVSGRVISRQKHESLPDLRVSAWHYGRVLPCQWLRLLVLRRLIVWLGGRPRTARRILIGSTTTDQSGRFSITASADRLAQRSIPPHPNLFFTVDREGTRLKSTEDNIIHWAESGRTDIVIEVDEAELEFAFTVGGRVLDLHQPPRDATALMIEAWHKQTHSARFIGRARTKARGAFLIALNADEVSKLALPPQFDLFFKVWQQDELIKSTEDKVLRQVESGRTNIRIEVMLPVRATFDEPKLAADLAVRLAGTPADGRAPGPGQEAAPAQVIWVDAGDEVLVHLDSAKVRLLNQMLLVSVDLETDQTARTPLVCAFALGNSNDQAGLVAVTDELPRGNALLAARWGKTLQAAVWSGLLSLAQDHANERFTSPRGLSASAGQLRIHTGPSLSVLAVTSETEGIET